jgi:hypothetical protein
VSPRQRGTNKPNKLREFVPRQVEGFQGKRFVGGKPHSLDLDQSARRTQTEPGRDLLFALHDLGD